MIESVVECLKGLPKELVIITISALPVSELRGAIPVALMMGMPPLKAFILSVSGNLLPVIPILLFLEPISNILMRFKPWRRFFEWLFTRTKGRGDIIQRYEALGLMLFVAIPLPMTGAWTGCIAASLFRIKFRYAFPAVLAGIIIAGVVVLSVCLFGKGAFSVFLAR